MNPDHDLARNLTSRGKLLAALRSALDSRGYLEVETPVLIRSPGLEPHLTAIEVPDYGYLATSPEYQMKRLLSRGLQRIYYLGKAFRGEEAGRHHNPEFTMLEFYQTGADYTELMTVTEAVIAEAFVTAGGETRVHRPGWGAVDLKPPWERITVTEAMHVHGGGDFWPRRCDEDEANAMREAAVDAGISVPADADAEEVFFRVFVERVEPRLGRSRPTILYDWPEPMAALARIRREGDRPVAERFEVFAGGLELANAFGELTDAGEQRVRLLRDQELRKHAGKPVYPLDEKFLKSLEDGMPRCSGIAVGVDRLAMLLCGAETIGEVMAFPPEDL